MAKRTGLAQGLWVAGVDISGDVGSIDTASGGNSPLDVTGIDKSAFEKLGGKRDGNLEYTAFFNDATGQAHLLLRPNAFTGILDWNCSWIMGSTQGEEAFCLVAREVDYAPTRGEDGSLTIKVAMPSNGYGAEWGRLLTAGKRTDSTATAPATGLDLNADGGASTAFGWQAWLHVFAFTGTSVTVTIQDSADNSSFANLTGGAFTAATAVGSQRLEGGRTATVRRYVKVNTTGTFSNAVFGVVFTRNQTAVAF